MLHTFVIRIRGGPADTLPGGSAVMCESLSSLPQPSLGAIKCFMSGLRSGGAVFELQWDVVMTTICICEEL